MSDKIGLWDQPSYFVELFTGKRIVGWLEWRTNRKNQGTIVWGIEKYRKFNRKPIKIYIYEMVGKWLGCIQPMRSALGHSSQGPFFFLKVSPFS